MGAILGIRGLLQIACYRKPAAYKKYYKNIRMMLGTSVSLSSVPVPQSLLLRDTYMNIIYMHPT